LKQWLQYSFLFSKRLGHRGGLLPEEILLVLSLFQTSSLNASSSELRASPWEVQWLLNLSRELALNSEDEALRGEV